MMMTDDYDDEDNDLEFSYMNVCNDLYLFCTMIFVPLLMLSDTPYDILLLLFTGYPKECLHVSQHTSYIPYVVM